MAPTDYFSGVNVNKWTSAGSSIPLSQHRVQGHILDRAPTTPNTNATSFADLSSSLLAPNKGSMWSFPAASTTTELKKIGPIPNHSGSEPPRSDRRTLGIAHYEREDATTAANGLARADQIRKSTTSGAIPSRHHVTSTITSKRPRPSDGDEGLYCATRTHSNRNTIDLTKTLSRRSCVESPLNAPKLTTSICSPTTYKDQMSRHPRVVPDLLAGIGEDDDECQIVNVTTRKPSSKDLDTVKIKTEKTSHHGRMPQSTGAHGSEPAAKRVKIEGEFAKAVQSAPRPEPKLLTMLEETYILDLTSEDRPLGVLTNTSRAKELRDPAVQSDFERAGSPIDLTYSPPFQLPGPQPLDPAVGMTTQRESRPLGPSLTLASSTWTGPIIKTISKPEMKAPANPTDLLSDAPTRPSVDPASLPDVKVPARVISPLSSAPTQPTRPVTLPFVDDSSESEDDDFKSVTAMPALPYTYRAPATTTHIDPQAKERERRETQRKERERIESERLRQEATEKKLGRTSRSSSASSCIAVHRPETPESKLPLFASVMDDDDSTPEFIEAPPRRGSWMQRSPAKRFGMDPAPGNSMPARRPLQREEKITGDRHESPLKKLPLRETQREIKRPASGTSWDVSRKQKRSEYKAEEERRFKRPSTKQHRFGGSSNANISSSFFGGRSAEIKRMPEKRVRDMDSSPDEDDSDEDARDPFKSQRGPGESTVSDQEDADMKLAIDLSMRNQRRLGHQQRSPHDDEMDTFDDVFFEQPEKQDAKPGHSIAYQQPDDNPDYQRLRENIAKEQAAVVEQERRREAKRKADEAVKRQLAQERARKREEEDRRRHDDDLRKAAAERQRVREEREKTEAEELRVALARREARIEEGRQAAALAKQRRAENEARLASERSARQLGDQKLAEEAKARREQQMKDNVEAERKRREAHRSQAALRVQQLPVPSIASITTSGAQAPNITGLALPPKPFAIPSRQVADTPTWFTAHSRPQKPPSAISPATADISNTLTLSQPPNVLDRNAGTHATGARTQDDEDGRKGRLQGLRDRNERLRQERAAAAQDEDFELDTTYQAELQVEDTLQEEDLESVSGARPVSPDLSAPAIDAFHRRETQRDESTRGTTSQPLNGRLVGPMSLNSFAGQAALERSMPPSAPAKQVMYDWTKELRAPKSKQKSTARPHPTIRLNMAKLGEIQFEDIKLYFARKDGKQWADVMAMWEDWTGSPKSEGPLLSRYRLIQAAVERIDASIDLLDRVSQDKSDAREELNRMVHGEWPLPKVLPKPAWERPRDASGHFFRNASAGHNLERRAERSSQRDILPSDRPPGQQFAFEHAPEHTPYSPDSGYQSEGQRNTEDSIALLQRAYTSDDRCETGGKSLGPQAMAHFLKLMREEREKAIRDAELVVEKAKAKEDEEHEFDPQDHNHNIYQVQRRELTEEAYDEDITIEMVQWTNIGDPDEDIDDANLRASSLASLYFGKVGWQTNCLENVKTFGIIFEMQGPGIHALEIRVERGRRTYKEQIRPKSTARFRPREEYFISERIVTRRQGDGLFEETVDAVQKDGLVSYRTYDSYVKANEEAIKHFIESTYRPTKPSLPIMALEKLAVQESLVKELEDQGDESGEEVTLFRKTHEFEGTALTVWVTQGDRAGPRN